MDQALFNINIEIVGEDIDLFIQALKEYGFINQAESVTEQIIKQIQKP